MLNSLKGQKLPSLPCDFRQELEANVKRVLQRRRWASRVRVASVVSVGICFAWALVAIHQRYVPDGKSMPAKCWAPVSLRHVIEKSDVLVHAQVMEVTPDARDLRKSILSKISPKSLVRTKLRLQVLKSYPPTKLQEIEALCSISLETVDYLEEAGGEGIFALAVVRDGTGELYRVAVEHGGIYWLSPRNQRVWMQGGPHVTRDRAWEILCGLYDYVYGDDETKDMIFEGVLSAFRDSNSLGESRVALEYLKLLSKAEIPQDDVMDAIELYYETVCANWAKRKYLEVKELEAYVGFVNSALRLLVEEGGEDCVDRVLSLWLEDMEQQRSVFWIHSHSIISALGDLILKFPGPNRKKRLVQLCTVKEVADDNDLELRELLKRRYRKRHIYGIGALIRADGEDIEAVLLDMFYEPGRFGIRDSEILGVVWEVLAQKGCTEIRPLLDELISDPEGTDLGITHDPNMQTTIERARYFRMRALMNALDKENLPRKEWEQRMIELYHIDPEYAMEYIKSWANTSDTELIQLLDKQEE